MGQVMLSSIESHPYSKYKSKLYFPRKLREDSWESLGL